MKKQNIMKIIDIASFAAVCIATLLVFVFQFVGEAVIVKVALGFYALGFLMLSVQFGLKIYDNFFAENASEPKNEIQNEADALKAETIAEEPAVTVENNGTIANEKSTKIWNIVGLAGSILVFVFTLVVLILY